MRTLTMLCLFSSVLTQQTSTVGAIVLTNAGDVFAGVSSGGIWMKSSGRVGHVRSKCNASHQPA